MDEMEPWAKPIKDVLRELKSSENGLLEHEARERLAQHGRNEIAGKKGVHGLSIFFSQFKNALILLLIAAAVIAYFLGETINSMVIISIVLLNALLGFFQEYKAELAVRELRKYITLRCKVLRNGKTQEIDSTQIVPGDIVYLGIGDIIPADIRLIKSDNFSADESVLTGESFPSSKKEGQVREKNPLPQHLTNAALMGTTVSSGWGYGVVVSTGNSTFFGRTASYMKEEPKTDFQKNIAAFSGMLLKVTVIMALFVFAVNALLGKGVFDSFLFAVALAVGITPEMLPIIVTISMSKGALKMAKEKVVIKRLESVEDLGNIDTLCCDKTGTLTEGKITLESYVNADGRKDERILFYGMLCNSAKGKKHARIFDNAMDKAVFEHENASLLEPELEDNEIVDINEFDFKRKKMSVVVKSKKGIKLIAKGAPENIVSSCSYAEINGKKARMTKQLAAEMIKKAAYYEKNGYRVLAVSEKGLLKKTATEKDETGMKLVGFLLFLDPPKSTAREALEMLEKLGVEIKIISGDSPTSTRRICEEVLLPIVEGRVVTGEELEKMSDGEFAECALKYNVFARITPEQKYNIVKSLSENGRIVGFLGDGANDAPALKAADVGISVDSATGIAKESADVILLQKSLRVISHGITQGRKTFGNVTKYILNTISANWGNMLTVSVSSLFMGFIPLLPSQILLNNFVSDVPLLTVSTDNVDQDFLKKPKKWNMDFITRFMVCFGLLSTAFDLLLIIPLYFLLHASPDLFRTTWFLSSTLTEIAVTFAIRTRRPFFKSKPSRLLVITSIAAAAAAIALVYSAFGAAFFEFVQIPWAILGFVFALVITYFLSAELLKRWFFKKHEI
ncbi:MAG: magnesium-translocating P-type ATPase [archaeon]